MRQGYVLGDEIENGSTRPVGYTVLMSNTRYTFFLISPILLFIGATITFSILSVLPGPAMFLIMIIPGPLLIPVAILPIVLFLRWISIMTSPGKTNSQMSPIPEPDGVTVNVNKQEQRKVYIQNNSKRYFFWLYVFIGCSLVSSLILLQMF